MTFGLSFLLSEEHLDKLGVDREVFDLLMQVMSSLLFENRDSELYEYI